MDTLTERRVGCGRRSTDREVGARYDRDGQRMTTAVLGDEHGLFLEALPSALRHHGVRVVGVGRTVGELVRAVGERDPDVCLLGQRLATPGRDAVAEVVEVTGRTKVIVLTADPATGSVVDALSAGACGCVHKTRGIEHLARAIENVMAGQIVIDAPQQESRGEAGEGGEQVRKLAQQLTDRERQCLTLLAEGLGTRGMANRLGVSTATVRTHVHSVLTKLCVHSRLAAVSCAVRYSLLDPSEGQAARRFVG
jgi:two-component system nitrate/nitrite response regulator NarL